MEAILLVLALLCGLILISAILIVVYQYQETLQQKANATPNVQQLIRSPKTAAEETPATPETKSDSPETPQHPEKSTEPTLVPNVTKPPAPIVVTPIPATEAPQTISKRKKFVLGMIFRELWQ